MKIRFAFLFVTLIAVVSALFAFMCYNQVVQYQQQIINQNKRIDEAVNKWARLTEEDLVILQKIDEQNKQIKEQDNKIRIQDAVIAETRARTKKK